LQALFDVGRAIDGFDQRLGKAAASLPARQGALLVGFDQADMVAGPLRRQRQPDGERALAASALLGGQYDRVHSEEVLRSGLRRSADTPN
jgi:hypothetical protein